MKEQHYAECDICGEKYWDEDIKAYLRDHDVKDTSTITMCIKCSNMSLAEFSKARFIADIRVANEA